MRSADLSVLNLYKKKVHESHLNHKIAGLFCQNTLTQNGANSVYSYGVRYNANRTHTHKRIQIYSEKPILLLPPYDDQIISFPYSFFSLLLFSVTRCCCFCCSIHALRRKVCHFRFDFTNISIYRSIFWPCACVCMCMFAKPAAVCLFDSCGSVSIHFDTQ